MRYLDRGMYDVVEAAHLIKVSPDTIVGWAQERRTRPALVTPSLDGILYSFHDLISLHVVSELARDRKVPLAAIARGITRLARELEYDRPLAHESVWDRLATESRNFFARYGTDWVDIGRGGQRAFQPMVLEGLRLIEYGEDRLASVWRPHRRVWLNPRVQAGASCIDNTRIPTATIFHAVNSGEPEVEVAMDYELDLSDVMAAVEFEHSLLERIAA